MCNYLGKNVQGKNDIFSPIKCFIFRTIISVIFSLKEKFSALLHSVNTVAIATTLGDYDGGTGLSQPDREKRKSTRHIFVAEQLGRDLHDVVVDVDTE